jgi:Tol biopolymer transport system component
MNKKGLVLLAAGLGLAWLGLTGPISGGAGSPAAAGQPGGTSSVAERQFAEAVALLKRESFSEAIAAYEKVIRLLPESPIAQDARYWIGQTYLRMGKCDEALSVFKKLLKDHPGSPIVPVTELMVARAEKEKEALRTNPQRSGPADQAAIVDPKTGAVFRRIHVLSGKSDVVYGPGPSLSPNGKFLLNEMTVIPLDGSEPFPLNEKKGLRGIWSPDGKMAAYYAENAIWIVPVSPESGRPAGPSKKLLDGKYAYQFPVSWSPDSTKIAFPRRDDRTEGDLWIYSLKDCVLTRLTDDPGYEPNASWMPDGKSLVYLTRGKTFEIRSVPAAGGESKKIIDMEVGELISLSPDGKWLAYRNRQTFHLHRMADGRIFPIALPEGIGSFLSWSRNGEGVLFRRSSYDWRSLLKIVSTAGGPSVYVARNFELWPYLQFWTAGNDRIVTSRAGDSQFVVVPISGGEPIPLGLDIASKEKLKPLSMSPDRKCLLFAIGLENGNEDLCTVPVSLEGPGAAGAPVTIFKDWDRRQVVVQSAWSPDGRTIAVIHKGDLWLTSSKEAKPVQLTKTVATEGNPRWSPGGDRIGFVSEIKEGESKLQVIPASGGDPVSLSDRFDDWCWSPDGKSLTLVSGSAISVVPNDGSKAREILRLESKGFTGRFWNLMWLPDGKRVAFIGERETGKGNSSQIYLASIQTGEITELAADDQSWKDGLYLSPDAKWISYYTDEFIKARPTSTVWEARVADLVREKK